MELQADINSITLQDDALQSGCDIETLQNAMGHSSIQTTVRYLNARPESADINSRTMRLRKYRDSADINSITSQDIEAFKAYLSTPARGLAHNSVTTHLRAIKSVFSFAHRNGLSTNPAKVLKELSSKTTPH
jgi:site-specific recombinase XerD